MRKIKYRGFGTSDKRWHYGFITIYESGKVIIGGFEVYPDSVGQYIGLNDKNNKEIYEKDIVVFDCYSYEEPESTYTGEIVYCNGNSCFSLNGYDDWGKVDYVPLCEIGGSYTTIIEAIGNTYENPELLEEE